jgi:hypothetical protein
MPVNCGLATRLNCWFARQSRPSQSPSQESHYQLTKDQGPKIQLPLLKTSKPSAHILDRLKRGIENDLKRKSCGANTFYNTSPNYNRRFDSIRIGALQKDISVLGLQLDKLIPAVS